MKRVRIIWENGQMYINKFRNLAISGIVNEHFYREDVVFLSIQKYPLKDNDEIVLKDERIK